MMSSVECRCWKNCRRYIHTINDTVCMVHPMRWNLYSWNDKGFGKTIRWTQEMLNAPQKNLHWNQYVQGNNSIIRMLWTILLGSFINSYSLGAGIAVIWLRELLLLLIFAVSRLFLFLLPFYMWGNILLASGEGWKYLCSYRLDETKRTFSYFMSCFG